MESSARIHCIFISPNLFPDTLDATTDGSIHKPTKCHYKNTQEDMFVDEITLLA